MTIIASLSGAWNTIHNSISGINLSSLTRIKDSIQVDRFIGLVKSVDYGNLAFQNRLPIAGTAVGAIFTGFAVRRACWYRKEATYDGAAGSDVSLRGACTTARDDVRTLADYITQSVVELNPGDTEYHFRANTPAATVAGILGQANDREGQARTHLLDARSEIQSDRAVRALLRQLGASGELRQLADSCQDPSALSTCRGNFRDFLENLYNQTHVPEDDTNTIEGVRLAKARLRIEVISTVGLRRHSTIPAALNSAQNPEQLRQIVSAVRGCLVGLDPNDVLISMDELDPDGQLQASLTRATQAKQTLEASQNEEATATMRNALTEFLRDVADQDGVNNNLKAACLVLTGAEAPAEADAAAGNATILVAWGEGAPDALPNLAAPDASTIIALYDAVSRATGVQMTADTYTPLAAFKTAKEAYENNVRQELLVAVDYCRIALGEHEGFQGAIAEQITAAFDRIGQAPNGGAPDDRLTHVDPVETVQTLYDALVAGAGDQAGLISRLNAEHCKARPAAQLRDHLTGVNLAELDALVTTLDDLVARSTLAAQNLLPQEYARRQTIANNIGVAAAAALAAAAVPEDTANADTIARASLYALQQKTDATFHGMEKWGYIGLWGWAAFGLAAGTAIWTTPRWTPAMQAFYQNAHRRLFKPLHVIRPTA